MKEEENWIKNGSEFYVNEVKIGQGSNGRQRVKKVCKCPT